MEMESVIGYGLGVLVFLVFAWVAMTLETIWKPIWLQRVFDQWAEASANPVRWRHALAVGAAALCLRSLWQGDWWLAVFLFVVTAFFTFYARNRHETLEHYRKRGVDPYDRKAVKEDEERVHREVEELLRRKAE